jgi:hypothetical protein
VEILKYCEIGKSSKMDKKLMKMEAKLSGKPSNEGTKSKREVKEVRIAKILVDFSGNIVDQISESRYARPYNMVCLPIPWKPAGLAEVHLRSFIDDTRSNILIVVPYACF